MSGFLSGALGNLLQGAGGTSGAGGLLSEAFTAAGGLQGIVSKFQAAGLGDKVQSWVGSGTNLPISASEVEQVFPPQQIASWAEAHGVPAGVATAVLAHVLPHAVDSQTPDGQVSGGTFGGTTPDPAAPPPAAAVASGQGFDFGGLLQKLIGKE